MIQGKTPTSYMNWDKHQNYCEARKECSGFKLGCLCEVRRFNIFAHLSSDQER